MERERLVSLDAFRGATIAAMILVNNPGDGSKVFRQLGHAAWDGCTLTDLIFPFFIFIMGVAIPLAFARRREGEGVAWPILRRTVLLVGLGVLLNAFPFTGLPFGVRFPGVLQRIGLCYLVAAPLALRVSSRGLFAIALGLLVGYALALQWGGDLSAENNVGAPIDRAIFGTHLYRKGKWDPEGLFSTIPAIATALSGVLAGRWIGETQRSGFERACGLFVAGVACIAVGFAWNSWQPINKQLWTSSYVFFTSGLALQTLAASYWVIDLQGRSGWATPFLHFGRNAIFVYMASHMVLRLLVFGVKVGGVDVKKWMYTSIFAESTAVTSHAWAVGYVTIWWAVVALMDRKRIYIRV
ncbi:MAG: acyltransferase family protein [Planctomycetota bacterium]